MGIGTKALVYGGNIFVKPISQWFGVSMGNPVGGLTFAILDSVGYLSERINQSSFSRLAKVAGTAGYGFSGVVNLYSTLNGDISSMGQAVFDIAMAVQLGVDTHNNYRGKHDLLDDLHIK